MSVAAFKATTAWRAANARRVVVCLLGLAALAFFGAL